MTEKVTQSLVVLVVRHDLSLEEGALSCRESRYHADVGALPGG